MKLSSISKKNKKLFELKFNKKSNYLRSLPKKKYEGLKKVEEGKTDLMIDKILGLGEFERDYKFFSPQKNANTDNPKNIIMNPNIKSSLKNKINYIIHKEKSYVPDNYKIEEEIDDKLYNSRDNIEMNSKYWRPKKLYFSSFSTLNSKRYTNHNNKDSFLSKIGNNIVNS